MGIEGLFGNALTSLGGFMLASVFLYVASRFVLKWTVPKQVYTGWVLVLLALTWWQLTHVNAPKFIITDEAGISSSIGGEISSDAPPKVTDEQRLIDNQKLYEQNK